MTADLIEPGSDVWRTKISPSKAAAILGVSPYESPLSLWHLMTGAVQPDPQSKRQARGHYLEDGILRWFFDQHEELQRVDTKDRSFVHPTLGWVANLDAEAVHRETGERFSVEAKSDGDAGDDRWGQPGTDEIPPYYACQALVSNHISGHRRSYFPMLSGRLEFREYVVDYDEEWATQVMEPALLAFEASLATGIRPPLDGHPATYESIKKTSPDITDSYVKLAPAVAVEYLEARDAAKAAQERADTARNVVLDVMGLARIAKCGDVKIARRQRTKSAPAFYDCHAAVASVNQALEGVAA